MDIRPPIGLLGLLLGCGDAGQDGSKNPGESASPQGGGALREVTAPHSAPGVLLLAELGADGYASVGGTVMGEVWVDLDAPEDETWAFRYQVLDARDALLYERTQRGPIMVRDFLGYYGDETGYDILAVFPLLGRFPIAVPLLDGADRVRLQLRGEDGAFTNIGSYDLADAATDDQGTSESVVGSETLYESGPSENRLDLVLVGDGYTEDQLEDWREDAEVVADALLSTEPLSSLSDYVNLHRVDAVSAESGASYDCIDECRMRDTAFGTVFPLNWINDLIGTDYDARAMFQLDQWEVARAVSVVPWDAVIVVSNSARTGGMAVHYASVTTGYDSFGTTAVHELGHALGGLGDEYRSDACIEGETLPPNIAADPDALPWSHWVDDGTPLPTPDTRDYNDVVGAFEGAYNCDHLYRPMRTCLMEDSDEGVFCPVCAEQMFRRVLGFADPVDGFSWSQDASGASFHFEGPRDLGVEIQLGEEIVVSGSTAETLTVPAEALIVGETLTVRAAIETEVVREDEGELTQVWRFEVE